jgi:hypothetical protein
MRSSKPAPGASGCTQNRVLHPPSVHPNSAFSRPYGLGDVHVQNRAPGAPAEAKIELTCSSDWIFAGCTCRVHCSGNCTRAPAQRPGALGASGAVGAAGAEGAANAHSTYSPYCGGCCGETDLDRGEARCLRDGVLAHCREGTMTPTPSRVRARDRKPKVAKSGEVPA